MTSINYVASFNGTSLMSVPGLQVVAIEDFIPPRVLNIFPLARRNASKLSSAFYPARKILISIYIIAASRAKVDQALDTLFGIIQDQEGNLTIEKSGTLRSYTATFSILHKNNTGIGRGVPLPPQGGYVDLTLEFDCSDSFGYDPMYTLIYNLSNQSGPSLTYPYVQGGSADSQSPFIQVQYQTFSTQSGTVTIGNQNTGQAISITRTWTKYDILQIDCRAKTVQVNGADIDFSGAFPEVGLGAQTIYYTDTFTSRLFNILAYVYNRWL